MGEVPKPVAVSKAGAKRALARHHFSPCDGVMEVFERLRSVQFDPIAPVGCNHDLVFQSRIADFRIGDWKAPTYRDRLAYDGWDKQASLVPMTGWPWRRIFFKTSRGKLEKLIGENKEAMASILREIREDGPMTASESSVKDRVEHHQGSWYGPSVAKRALRALWHTGEVMTTARKSGHHVYDLTERVVPDDIRNVPELQDDEAFRELVLERHRAVGIVRPSAAYEMWSYVLYAGPRAARIAELVEDGRLVPVNVEGMKAHASPEFLALLEKPSIEPRAVFVAPLDPLLWDRKMVGHVFDFDYVWEIYTPEAKRRWGYYVLPVLYGDELVARAEFWCRKGVLEIKVWIWEDGPVPEGFFEAAKDAIARFARYCSAGTVTAVPGIDPRIVSLL